MTKYIDAEKLKTEIERLREINRKALEAGHIEAGVFHGRAQTLNYLFEFIDSLQQEQLIQVNTLTWKDINDLERIINNVHYEFRNGIGEKSFGKEVLERFREERDEQEQPKVDLEKAARYVYESWICGTMDDVRQDMVELGKVLNARKEK